MLIPRHSEQSRIRGGPSQETWGRGGGGGGAGGGGGVYRVS